MGCKFQEIFFTVESPRAQCLGGISEISSNENTAQVLSPYQALL
jgi:hypothetical protein